MRPSNSLLLGSWRVVIVTRILPVALGFHTELREAGHEPAALLTLRETPAGFPLDELVLATAGRSRSRGRSATATRRSGSAFTGADGPLWLVTTEPAAP